MSTDNTIINVPTPKFGINEVVYLRESALLGYLEAVKVYNVFYNKDIGRTMYVFVFNKSSPKTQIVGDNIDLKHGKAISVVEEELLTYEEALQIKARALENELEKTLQQLSEKIGNATIEVVEETTGITAPLEFGDVAVGSMVERTYTITNTGELTLMLTGSSPVQVLGDTDDFLVSLQPSSLIQPGDSDTFRLRFAPIQTGRRVASILINNNDPDSLQYTFSVEGMGV